MATVVDWPGQWQLPPQVGDGQQRCTSGVPLYNPKPIECNVPSVRSRQITAQLMRQGWIAKQQARTGYHRRTGSPGQSLSKQKAYYQRRPSLSPSPLSAARPGGCTPRLRIAECDCSVSAEEDTTPLFILTSFTNPVLVLSSWSVL